ncbi:type II toxin-antitoxin system RelE/ParE family toxin [Salinicola peritrichatus]|uniref:type II toxin-antitoxin system RelE/ParE family toxin n=1 Tax=Salinicola peritrichatus TaxID=1267424 RepID=UPI000DA216BB|nr:type II toxin-antitoxin system RelE/ParE family toxin [Salinicola peritrichatus]
MIVRWLERAIVDLEGIADYIAMDRPDAALSIVDRVEASAEAIPDNPQRGRSGRVSGTRELIIAGTPYLIVYRISPNTIDVLRVLHGAQQWPPSH